LSPPVHLAPLPAWSPTPQSGWGLFFSFAHILSEICGLASISPRHRRRKYPSGADRRRTGPLAGFCEHHVGIEEPAGKGGRHGVEADAGGQGRCSSPLTTARTLPNGSATLLAKLNVTCRVC